MKNRVLASLVVGALLLVGGSVYGLWVGASWALGKLVRLVPVSWEERLGRAVVSGLTQPAMLCGGDEVEGMLGEVVERLSAAMPRGEYEFRVKVVRQKEVNALAAPGGHIVLFSGLLGAMENVEQVAAVVAHEMQHVVQRHSTRGMMRVLGLQAFLTLTLGDPGLLGELAGNLTVMHFQRGDEQSADDAALEVLMRAGIAPRHMEEAFANLERVSGEEGSGGVMKYLSTHPPLGERRARVRERGKNFPGPERPFAVRLVKECRP
jgi:predicted Zn-dependent protease